MSETKRDDSAVIEKALKRFKRAEQAESSQRTREKDDLEFEFEPWSADARTARGAYKIGNEIVPARPMLNIPMLDQPIQLVINQEKAAHLGIEVHPDSEDATDETAEVQQGLIRQIEVRSRANLARSWAFERAAKCGRGFYRILKKFCNPSAEGPEASDQELVISRILDQSQVFMDPDALEPDWSDGIFAFIAQNLSDDRYNIEFPHSELAAMSSDDFGGLSDNAKEWVGDDTRRIAEYFEVVFTPRKDKAIFNGKQPDGYPQERKVIWRKINAVEVLKEVEWDGQYIPIIPVIGREYNINGKRLWNGIIGPAKDPVRLVNSTASLAMEKIAMDAKTPWVLAEGQEEGHEAEFIRASVRPVPYLRYKPTSLSGLLVPPPERNVAGPNIQADIEMLQVSKDFVHGATFTFDPSLGQTSAKDRSGKAILAQQQQADSSNSHYLDNLAEVSMPYEAKVLLDMFPRVYDRAGRLVSITDAEDQTKHVMLNQPYTQGPNKTDKPQALQMDASGQPIMPQGPSALPVKHYNLKTGSYTSVVNIGKSYQTKMAQGLDAMGQIIASDPAMMMPVLGWRWIKYNDSIPHNDEIAEDLKKLRPPQLQDDNGQNDPQRLQQQLQQMGQQHQMLVQELNAKNQYIEREQAKVQGQIEVASIKSKTDIATATLDRDAKIVIAAIGAKMDDKNIMLEAATAAAELLHTSAENQKDRAHEAGMAAAGAQTDANASQQEHQQGLEAGQADAANESAQSAQEHGQALEQGDAATQGQIAVQAAAPQPEASA